MTEFKKEFAAVWPRITNKPFFFALLAAWLLLFHFIGNSSFGYYKTPSLLRWMFNTYNEANSDDSHGLLIPFAVLGADLVETPTTTRIATTLLVAGSGPAVGRRDDACHWIRRATAAYFDCRIFYRIVRAGWIDLGLALDESDVISFRALRVLHAVEQFGFAH